MRIIIIALLLAVSVHASDWYASPTGSGSGTLADPMSLRTALTSSMIHGGDTLWLRGGPYQVGGKPYRFTCSLSGSAGNYITVRNYNNERAIIDCNITRNQGTGYVIFRGLEVTSSISGRHTAETGSWPALWRLPDGTGAVTEYCCMGFELRSIGDKVVNCYIHDCIGGGIGVWQPQSSGIEVTGCIIYGNGWYAPDRTHGHGIYWQNDLAKPRELARDNILLNNADHGAQFYGSDTAPTCNVDILGNYFADNGVLYTEAGNGGCNVTVGSGTITYNNTFVGNYVWRTPGTKGDGGGDHNQGYDQNTVGLAMSNNIIVTKSTMNVGPDSKITGNSFFGTMFWGHALTSASFPGNTYAVRPTSGYGILLRQNPYDPNRANLFINNYGRSGTIDVNLGSLGFSPGSTVELHNAQNFYGDVKTLIYSGSTVSVPMTGHTTAKPVDALNPVSTLPDSGAIVILRTGTGPATNIVVTPPVITNTPPPVVTNTCPPVTNCAPCAVVVCPTCPPCPVVTNCIPCPIPQGYWTNICIRFNGRTKCTNVWMTPK